jgi:hypothetical protein
MDFVQNVGRREKVVGDNGDFINVGIFSLNGYEHKGLYRNQGGGKFLDVGYLTGADRIEDGRGLGILDADGDGRLDLVTNNYLQHARLLMNRSPAGNHWLRLQLQGTRSNRSAIGARVVAYHGVKRTAREVTSFSGYLSGQSLYLHFGLGQDASVDRLMVFWPSGLRQEFKDLPADAFYRIVEGEERPTLRLPAEAPAPAPPPAPAPAPAIEPATAAR